MFSKQKKTEANLTSMCVGLCTQGPSSSKHPLSLLIQEDDQQFKKLTQMKVCQNPFCKFGPRHRFLNDQNKNRKLSVRFV